MNRRKARVWAKLARCMGHYDVQATFPDLESAHKAGQAALKDGRWEWYTVNGLKIQEILDAQTFRKAPFMTEDEYQAILRAL